MQWTTKYAKSWFTGIMILKSDADFFNRMQRDLIKISQSPIGGDLLRLIAKRNAGTGTSDSGLKRTVYITARPLAKSEGAETNAAVIANKFSRLATVTGGRQMLFAGKGSFTNVFMHNEAASEATYTRLAGMTTPTFIAVAHELIHAWHHLSGTAYEEAAQSKAGETAKREEMYTTGLGAYANTRISENAIRREHNLPVRTFYTFPDDHKLLASHMNPNAVGLGHWACSNIQGAL